MQHLTLDRSELAAKARSIMRGLDEVQQQLIELRANVECVIELLTERSKDHE